MMARFMMHWGNSNHSPTKRLPVLLKGIATHGSLVTALTAYSTNMN
jgi:hypothetical protein